MSNIPIAVYQSKQGRLYLKKEEARLLTLLVCLQLNPTKQELLNPSYWKETIVLEKIYDIR